MAAAFALLLSACAPQGQAPATANAIADVQSRKTAFPDYPQADRTYLSFDGGHGFQVNYIGRDGRAWLWYPGNVTGVPELYERRTVAGRPALCWAHPSNSRNPVTGHRGGGWSCTPLDFARKTIVAVLDGDPYRLASGKVPYRLKRCDAPEAFRFDRAAISC